MAEKYEKLRRVIEAIEDSPVVSAIKNEEGLEACLKTDCTMVFILYGSICSIAEIVEKIKREDKIAIVHADLIQGLSTKNEAIDFICYHTKADGIISTKATLVKHAINLGMIGILRTFMIDSMAMENIKKQVSTVSPDLIEIMPGILPEIIGKVKVMTEIPIIAGGLISTKKDVINALNAGATAISTTNLRVWEA